MFLSTTSGATKRLREKVSAEIKRAKMHLRRVLTNMSIKYTFATISCGVFLLLSILSHAGNNDTDEVSHIMALRYQGSFDVRAYESKNSNRRVTIYKVRLKYPSKAVLKFYDFDFKKIGLVPFSEVSYRASYRNWVRFQDGTKKGNPIVHQLMAKWTDTERRMLVILAIRYYSRSETKGGPYYGEEPDNDVQNVYLQLIPFQELPAPGTKVPLR